MRQRHSRYKNLLVLPALSTFLWVGTPANAQSVPARNTPPVQDNDTTRQELASFNQFLDSHPELARDIRKDPSLVNNDDFVKRHPSLQTYLQDHPQVSDEIRENPNAFMRQEYHYDRREDDRDRDINREDLARFDQFLDSHRETAEQLRKDPSLVDNQEYVRNHPELQAYLEEHAAIREEIKENPNAFMRQEYRYDHREDDRDRTNREELARFDQFLDTHRETAQQLRKDPSLMDNEEFVKNHPALQSYLRDHPELRAQLKQDPNAFLHQEERYDRREDDRGINRGEVARFNQFLDAHRETAEQLRKDPSLVDNQEFMRSHPELQAYLQDHPGIRDQIKQDPNAFMHAEDRYDRREDDRDRQELARFDQFLDSHRETAEQLRKNPSLVDNEEFVRNHPALQAYLHDHPELRAQLKQDPNAFMQQEARYARYDNRENGMDRDATSHRQAASFGEFLGGHSEISQHLSEDPSLVKNQEYMENHPELREYLTAHPEVKQELMANPQSFVKSAQQFRTTSNTAPTVKTPMPDPAKPKQ
jgi:hypothetical protein